MGTIRDLATWRNGSRAALKMQSQKWGVGSTPTVATYENTMGTTR